MSFLASLGSLYSSVFHRSQMDREMEDELRSHIQHRADDLERSGMPRAEAERRARIEFGGYVRFKEESLQALGGQLFETLWQDVRFSWRKLRQSPGFAIAAVLTLAMAIGANAVVFGMLNALFLRPLNVPQPESLYSIERGADKDANESYPDYLDLRDRSRTFDGVALYNIVSAGLDTGHNATQFWGYEVSGNYFDALRIRPFLGRFFHDSDEHGSNSAPYLVISHAYWHSRFQDDPSVVGRVVQVNQHPFTILGVAPEEFHGTLLFFFPDFWLPVVDHEQLTGMNILNARGDQSFIMTMGHLKPGVTTAQAIADLNSVGAWLEKTYPKDDAGMTFALARPSLAGDLLGPPARGFISALMLLAGLILLAACANLGSLFAARASDRSREVALRLALGSSRRRILRSVLTEAVMISLAGGGIGLAGSVALLRAMSVWHPIPTYPIVIPVNPDGNVYWVALLLALVSGFLFGMVPVRQILRTNPYEIVKAGSSSILVGNSGRRITVRDLLLVAQISICAVLVTSSLVAVRGLLQSMHSNFGFEPEHALLVDTNLTMAGYGGERATEMQKRMKDALAAIPGVDSVGVVNQVPLSGNFGSMDVYRDETTDFRPSNVAADVMTFKISPDYFRAAGTSLLAGRSFTWHDDQSSTRVAVINREFASRIFGSANVIGRHFKLGDGTRVEVVGITGEGKYYQLTERRRPALFLPMQQWPATATSLIVRSGRQTQPLAAAIRLTLLRLDAGLPFEVRTWEDELSVALFPSRVATMSLGVLGAMGTVLAITGIFGMAAYSVSKRLRELGIRMALGAQHREILRAALGRPLKLLALGSAAGLLLGLLATRILAYIVYQANPRDPVVLGGVVVTMLLMGLVATWIPAQRALSVDPLILLRED
jgi:predicted permease